jgi:hypothetical protein
MKLICIFLIFTLKLIKITFGKEINKLSIKNSKSNSEPSDILNDAPDESEKFETFEKIKSNLAVNLNNMKDFLESRPIISTADESKKLNNN